jgi:diguanylate cyclase (GGDEF)-like protein
LRRFASSLAGRLLLFAVALVVGGSFGRSVVLAVYLRDDITALITAQQVTLAQLLVRDIDVRVTERLNLLQKLSAALPPALLDQPEQLQVWLGERQTLLPLFSEGLMVVPASGAGVVAGYPDVPARRQIDFTGEAWFVEARDQGRVSIGRPYRDKVTGKALIVMAIPLGTDGTGPRPVLAGVEEVSAPGFLEAVGKARFGDSGGVLLVSPRDTMFIASNDPKMTLRDTPPPGVNRLHDRAMTGWRGTGTTVNTAGQEMLATFVSVASADWFLVVRMPTEEAFRSIERMRNYIMQGSALFVVGLIVVLFIVLPRMFKPMRDAAREMLRMANGETELRPLAIVRDDEVGTLVAGFNYLLEEVNKREAIMREREAQMTRKAHHDPLTGLPNRAMFSQTFQLEIAFADMAGNAFALMFLDLDGFKPVNDSYGHAAGDEVLRQVAARLRDAVRPQDSVARLGGDEFVIMVITGLDDPRAAAEAVAQHCLKAIALPFAVAGTEIRIGLSIGIAISPDHGVDPSLLMGRADTALYLAKKGGRGRFVFFQDECNDPDGCMCQNGTAPKM